MKTSGSFCRKANILCFESVDSTNERAKALAREGAETGTIVTADRQTAGKGRKGREWSSPPGKNLYFSLLLRSDTGIRPDAAPMLTLVMALAVREAIASLGIEEALIKWPNDIVVHGKKVCGILTEMAVEKEKADYVIIGVGVNCKKQEFAPEIAEKASSLEQETGREILPAVLLEKIRNTFADLYAAFLQTADLSGLREAYNACLVNRGREVRVLDLKGAFDGTAKGINDRGELLVQRADGRMCEIYAGEVSVRGIYGYV